ncbi:MAG: repair protein RecO [Patescibacteria group bacterium]|jgi:DNA repair protein RecO|nr:repair protein RecO [Patescibacteria group bacterium]
MGAFLRDEAVVLRLRPFREADAWVSCWTKHHGKHDVLATGLRKAHAKQQGHMQPFAFTEVVFVEGKEVERLTIGRMTAFHGGYIRDHQGWLQIAASVSALCDAIAVTGEEQESTRVFELFQEIHRLAVFYRKPFSPTRSRLIEALFLDRLMQALGYGISLERCVRCQQEGIDLSGFSLREGGFFCSSCASSAYGSRSLPFSTPQAELAKLLTFFRAHPIEQALHVSAPQTHFLDATQVFEAMFEVLPVSRSPLSSPV